MPRSHRLFRIALFTWLALVVVGKGYATAPKNNQAQQEKLAASQNLSASVAQYNSNRQLNLRCEQGQDNRSSQLCAYWKSADEAERSANWSHNTFLLGCGGAMVALAALGAAIAAALFARNAAIHTRDGAMQSERSANAAYAAIRPWLDFHFVGDLQIQKFGDPEFWIGLKMPLNVTNYGNSPAIRPTITYRIAKGQIDPDAIVKELAHQIESGKGFAGESIFGGMTYEKWSDCAHAQKIEVELEVRTGVSEFIIKEYTLFVVIGYQATSGGYFYTAKVFHLWSEKHSCRNWLITPEPFFDGRFTAVS